MTTQLLSSGEFCKLRYDTIPVKSASANVSFYTNNSKMQNFELWHCCRKFSICLSDMLQPVKGHLQGEKLMHSSSNVNKISHQM